MLAPVTIAMGYENPNINSTDNLLLHCKLTQLLLLVYFQLRFVKTKIQTSIFEDGYFTFIL